MSSFVSRRTNPRARRWRSTSGSLRLWSGCSTGVYLPTFVPLNTHTGTGWPIIFGCPNHVPCFRDGQYRQSIGIALESRRIDKLKESILKSEDVASTLAYTLKASLKLVTSREFRQQVNCAETLQSPPSVALPW
eukprot:1183811-Prorocentrum_minimum.AAC.3